MKRISPGTVSIGVFAILFGLGVAYAARHYLNQIPLLAPAARPKTATIVVPRVNLPKYVRIRSDDVDTMQVPLEQLPEGVVQMKSRALFRLVKARSEEHTSELQSHSFISYAVFCLKKKNIITQFFYHLTLLLSFHI